MQNPFDINANANAALMGGAAADNAAGFGSPRPQAGMRTASNLIAEAKSRLDAQAPAPAPQPSVLGFNPQTNQFFSAGKTWGTDNLSEVDNYDKAGYLDFDNRGKLPEGFAPVTPDYVRAWKEKKAAGRGFFSAAGETGKQALQGIPDIVNMGVQAAAMSAPAGSWLEGQLGEAASNYDKTSSAPDVYGRGETAQAFIGAGRSLPASVAAGAASIAAPVVGTAGAGYVMGAAQAWDTYQRGLAAGLSPEAAKAAAVKTGSIEGIGETAADALGARVTLGAGKVIGGMMRGATVGQGKRVAVDLLANAALQSGTEYAQSYGQAAVEKDAGVSDQDPNAAGYEGFKQGLAMSALMAPFGAAAGFANRPGQNLPPPAPVQPPATPAPTLDPNAPVGETGDMFGGRGPEGAPAAPAATSYRETLLQMMETQGDLEIAEANGDMDQASLLRQELTDAAARLASMGGQQAGQRPIMSGVNEIISGKPVELTGDELASGNMPFVDAGFDRQANAFSLQEPSAQQGLDFEELSVEPTQPSPRGPKRAQNLTADELSFEGQPLDGNVAMDVRPVEGPLTPAKVASAINPGNVKSKRMFPLVRELSAALIQPNRKKLDEILFRIGKVDDDIHDAAAQLIEDTIRSQATTMAQEGARRAAPGGRGDYTGFTKGDSAAIAVQRSDAQMEEETAPDETRSTPNEMDPSLVKEHGPKGPASTLALRGQTQVDLDTLNSREQWLAGPQENTGPAAVPANQLAMFDRKGQPTNPAMGVPKPVLQPEQPAGDAGKGAGVSQPKPVAPKRGPKSRKPLSEIQPIPTAAAENTNSTAVTIQEGGMDVAQQSLMRQIAKADEDGSIDFSDKVELEQMVHEGRVPQAKAKLHRLAVANKGESGARYSKTASNTALDAKALEMVKAGDLIGALRHLSRNASTPEARALAQRLQGLLSKVTVSVVQDLKSTEGQPVIGAYFNSKIELDASRGLTEDTLLHEAVHAATEDTLSLPDNELNYTQRRAKAELTKLWNAAKQAGVPMTADAQSSLSEFATEALTTPELMTALKAQPWSLGRMWDGFKSALLKLIGVTKTDNMQLAASAAMDSIFAPPANFAEPAYRTTTDAITEAINPIKYTIKYDVIGAAKRGMLSSTFLRDLGARFSKDFARVDEHVKTVFRMGAKAGEIQKKAQDVSIAWQGLSDKESSELSALMHEVTSRQLSMESDVTGLTADEKSQQDELRKQFNALTEKQKTAYRMSRDELKSEWQQAAKLLARKADDVYGVLIAKAQAAGNVAQVKSLTNEMNAYIADNNARVSSIRGDYFPLARFGQWSVVKNSESFNALQTATEKAETDLQELTDKLDQHTADQRKAIRKANKGLSGDAKLGEYTPQEQAQIDAARKKATDLRAQLEDAKSNPNEHYVAQFDSEGQAQAHRAQVGGYVSNRQDRSSKEVGGVSRQMLDRLDQALELQFGKNNSSAAREAQRSLYQIYLSSLPEASALKRQMKRKTVAGANKDMHRNVVSTLFRNSFFLSRMEFGDQVAETLNSVRQEADEAARQSAKKGTDMQAAAAELERRHEATMSYTDTPVQDKITAISYLWFLGASPAFLITNMMQPGMVTIPMLTSRHGAATAGAMASAYKQTWKALRNSYKAVKEFSIEHSGLSEPHKKMLTYLMENRLLDVTMAHDLSTIADGGKVSKVTRLISNPSHYAELLNRISSSIAAYDLEMARTGDSAKAQQYAAKVVSDTHLDYSAENAPYWMKPGVVPLGKLLFQFKKYQLGMMSLLIKNAATVMNGATKEERREAAGMLVGVFATHGLVAGSVGLPVAGTVMAISQLVARAFGDEPEDVEAAYRNWLNRTFGKTAGTAIAKGVPAAFGIDMSQKAGLANVMNPLSGVRDSDTKKGRDLYLEYLAGAAGPAIGGLGARGFEFYDFMSNGEYNRAAASMLPKMFADVFKGARYAEEGVMTRQGRTLAESNGIPMAILLGSGFPLTAVADTYAANASKQGLKAALDDMKGDVLREWMRSDPAERLELQKGLPELNKIRAEYKLPPVTMGDLFRYQNQMRRPSIKNAEINAIGAYAAAED